MTSWRSQNPFEDADQFQQRLTLDNLTEDDLRRMLAEPADQVRNRLPSTPGWITTIEVALSTPPTFEFHHLLTDRLRADATIGFLDVAAPFIGGGLGEFEAGAALLAKRLGSCPFDPATVVRQLFPEFARALLRIVGRTMVSS